ncbi:RsbRD N-terminal domain-containing protein [candidate division CSSED10-310 bacterium]|uniref:RsbRD N-terminal domain-containing protein n=1 Tax=candidate division CSSED10-310 bacterium TaxID=2855610 RepID=A0ABV6YRU0_UNCC1
MDTSKTNVLKQLLIDSESDIKQKWLDQIIETYPADTSRFLVQEKDRFLNPVGFTLEQAIQTIFHEFLTGTDREKLSTALHDIIKIRSVQEFSPSEALRIIFILKKVIREELGAEIARKKLFDELFAFESGIDELMLLCFDIYSQCREKIYEIKFREIKNRHYKLLERMNIFKEEDDDQKQD